MSGSYCLIHTTTDNQAEAEHLAELLITKKLAACVQIMPITSYYTWQGALNNHPEFLLFIKTKTECYPKVEAAILTNHSYETPEIIHLTIDGGTANYLGWIDQQTKS
jgi:periplasmic divalent cation tolerance protein